MTFAEFEQVPDTPFKQELIDGELIEFPPNTYRHSIISERVYLQLRAGAPGKRAHHGMGYRIGGGWLRPNVSVTRPKQEAADDYLIGSPALAVEILTDRHLALHFERKLALYFAEGAEEIWVIDPSNRAMSVYRTTPEGVLRSDVEEEHLSKFGAIKLAALFADEVI